MIDNICINLIPYPESSGFLVSGGKPGNGHHFPEKQYGVPVLLSHKGGLKWLFKSVRKRLSSVLLTIKKLDFLHDKYSEYRLPVDPLMYHKSP